MQVNNKNAQNSNNEFKPSRPWSHRSWKVWEPPKLKLCGLFILVADAMHNAQEFRLIFGEGKTYLVKRS